MDASMTNTHYLFPGNLFVHHEPHVVTTILGSCVSVTMCDSINRVGGITHYMMPLWNGEGLPTPKYGNIAIKKLLEKMLSSGAEKKNIKAKIVGGSSIYAKSMGLLDIGVRNVIIAEDCLAEERIPVICSDTGGDRGRRVQFFTETGIVRVKTLNKINGELLNRKDR